METSPCLISVPGGTLLPPSLRSASLPPASPPAVFGVGVLPSSAGVVPPSCPDPWGSMDWESRLHAATTRGEAAVAVSTSNMYNFMILNHLQRSARERTITQLSV